ncbi:MAG TPA: hypothetical protein HA271_01045 [Methanobacterium subterraneum]|uniref:PepSY domain-containing protein n=1 Tax=Methanobacterium subterraneum TaxID=59277 RepID=A0A7J4TG94_9EURY|nr:hypothetical protein [Methanobacterium subterraneum]
MIILISVIAASWLMQPSPTNNTSLTNTGNSNATNGSVNNTSVPKVDNDNKNPPPPGISSEEAKELAKKYVGSGVIMGKPVLTTYKRIRAWQVPVYTRDHKFLNNIYIDNKTGRKVD